MREKAEATGTSFALPMDWDLYFPRPFRWERERVRAVRIASNPLTSTLSHKDEEG